MNGMKRLNIIAASLDPPGDKWLDIILGRNLPNASKLNKNIHALIFDSSLNTHTKRVNLQRIHISFTKLGWF